MAPNRVPLMVYVPCRFVVKLSLSLSEKVSDLRKVLKIGNDQFSLIFQGQLLLDSVSLESYHIKEKDTIVAIPITSKETEIDKWLTITKDVETFHEKIHFMSNEKTTREAGRIRDLIMTKIERKPRSFRKLCQSVQSAQRPIESKSIDLVLNWPKQDGPSCEPLPFLEESFVDSTSVATTEPILADKQEQTDSIAPTRIVKP